MSILEMLKRGAQLKLAKQSKPLPKRTGKKRGRPRGRPRKDKPLPKPKPPVAKKPRQKAKPKARAVAVKPRVAEKTKTPHCTLKMFFANKKVSKELPWWPEWLAKYSESSCCTAQKELIDSLVVKINEFLKADELEIEVPVYQLLRGDECIKILFDPYDRGVEIDVKYSSKSVRIGDSPREKSTRISNLLNDKFRGFLSVGTTTLD